MRIFEFSWNLRYHFLNYLHWPFRQFTTTQETFIEDELKAYLKHDAIHAIVAKSDMP